MAPPIMAPDGRPMYEIPIAQRPPHGPIFSKVFFPLVFNLGQLGINSAQFLCVPLLLIPFVGRRWFDGAIAWTKDGYGRLLIGIIVLFGPTSIVLTTDAPPSITNLVERDDKGQMTKLNLPDRLVIMANHQAYTDWVLCWLLACYSGRSAGIIILLKASLKKVPVVGWGMRFFKFIFLNRSWAADRANLTKALTDLGQQAKSDSEKSKDEGEHSALLGEKRRSPLWLLIFPEGTITSDEERVKSKRYAEREGIDDFVTMLHPRSTGLLFALRTLVPQIPDLKLMDITIGYPGVPYGKYPQDYYGLLSIFFRSVPPPSIHMHLHIYDDLASPDCPIPSLTTSNKPADETAVEPDTGLASPEEARAFELWLRGVWQTKEKRMERFYQDHKFVSSEGENAREIVPVRQIHWYHWIGAFGGGGMGTAALVGVGIWRAVVALKS